MKKIAFITLGCKLNYAETSTYERSIVGPGIEVVAPSAAADVYLVNTCSVTEHSDKKCRNIIRKLHRTAPEAAIFVTGCYAELKRGEIEAIDGVRAVFGAAEKKAVAPAVVEYLQSSVASGPAAVSAAQAASEAAERPADEAASEAAERPAAQAAAEAASEVAERPAAQAAAEAASEVAERPAAQAASGAAAQAASEAAPMFAAQAAAEAAPMFAAYSSGERTRSFLKVQDGCDFKCAYCTVPYARGESRNIPIAEVLRQAREIAAAGIKEIVLTGVNTGDFGKTTGETFFDLIRALNDVEGIERYRISSIEPNLLTEEMVDWIASGTKFLPHFHIPLQSGSDTVLRQMGRRYDTAAFEHKINYIRSKMEAPGRPPVFFGIDVIVGFPGETDALFDQTYNFLKDRIRPAFIHIFPYSRRAGTPAAARKDQVQDRIKTERVERLEALCADLHADFVARNKGLCAKVLFESSDKNGKMYGYTGNYIRIERPYDPDAVGKIVDITI